MGRYDEPTQQVRTSPPPAAPLPGSLDPLRGDRDGHQPGEDVVETGTGWVDTSGEVETPVAEPEPTGVLPLDEIFDSPGAITGPRESTAAAQAPTWTAMPVVPVRSEPIPDGQTDWRQPDDEAASSGTHSPALESAGAAWTDTRVRFEAWLRRDDNGLMLLTAVIACVLMIVVAGVGG